MKIFIFCCIVFLTIIAKFLCFSFVLFICFSFFYYDVKIVTRLSSIDINTHYRCVKSSAGIESLALETRVRYTVNFLV